MTFEQASAKIESLKWVLENKEKYNPDGFPILKLIVAPTEEEAFHAFYDDYIMSGPFNGTGQLMGNINERTDLDVYVHFDNSAREDFTGEKVLITKWEEFLANNPDIYDK